MTLPLLGCLCTELLRHYLEFPVAGLLRGSTADRNNLCSSVKHPTQVAGRCSALTTSTDQSVAAAPIWIGDFVRDLGL